MKELDALPQNVDYRTNTDVDLQLSSSKCRAFSTNTTESMVAFVKLPFTDNGGGLGRINMIKAREIAVHHSKTLMKQTDMAKGIIGIGPPVPLSHQKRNWYSDKVVDRETNPQFEHHWAWNHGPASGYDDPHNNRKFFHSIRLHATLPPTHTIRSRFSKTMNELKGISLPPKTTTPPVPPNVPAVEPTPAAQTAIESPPSIPLSVEQTPAAQTVVKDLPDDQINSNGKRPREEWACDVVGCGRTMKLSKDGGATDPIRKHIAKHDA